MDYTTLQSDLADLLDRSDLTSQIPGFIRLCEAQLNRDLRHWQMENRATAATTERYVPRPTDWVETIQLINTSTGKPMRYVSRFEMNERRYSSNLDSDGLAGNPEMYRHSEGNFELYPTPASATTLEIEYLQKIPALSGSNTTNWVIDSNPDVYLYGSAIHSAPFLHDDVRISTWAQLYSAAVARVNLEGKQAEHSGGKMRMRRYGMG